MWCVSEIPYLSDKYALSICKILLFSTINKLNKELQTIDIAIDIAINLIVIHNPDLRITKKRT